MKRAGVTVLGLLALLLGGAGEAPGQKDKKGPLIIRGKPLEAWVKALEGKDLAARIEALNAVRQAGPQAKAAVPALIGLFQDREATFLHPLAASTLARIGAPAVGPLRAALLDKRPTVRSGSALALGLLGDEARPAVGDLAKALDDREGLVRTVAATALGQIGPAAREALPRLRKSLADGDESARVEAALALWKVNKESKGLAALIAAVKERAGGVERASEALAEMGKVAADAAPALRIAVTKGPFRARLRAAEALWKVADDGEASAGFLGKALKLADAADRREAAATLGVVTAHAAELLPPVLEKDADERVRREAACSLAEPAVARQASPNALRFGTGDADPGVRWWSAVALLASGKDLKAAEDDVVLALREGGREGDPAIFDVLGPGRARALPALLAGLKARRVRVRTEAARALGLLGEDGRPAQKALLALLDSSDRQMRRAAADTLGRTGPEVVPALRKRLTSEEANVREGAARALGAVGPAAKEAVPGLLRLLKDPEPGVRTQAALALWYVDPARAEVAVPILNLVVKDVDNKDRWEAMEGLSIIAEQARPPIRGLTDVLYQALKDRDPQVRVQAAKGLWRRVKLERVVVPIVQPLLGERDAFVRRTAVEVLSELKGEGNRVVPLLCTALDDRVADVRLTALEALVRLGKDDEPFLLREAKNKSPRVRAGVATALGRRPGAEALKALALLERDEDRLVRAAAVAALRRHFRNKG